MQIINKKTKIFIPKRLFELFPTIINLIKKLHGKNRLETCRITCTRIIPLMMVNSTFKNAIQPLFLEFEKSNHLFVPSWEREISESEIVQYFIIATLCWKTVGPNYDYENVTIEALQALHPWLLKEHLEEMFCIRHKMYIRNVLQFFTHERIIRYLDLIIEYVDSHHESISPTHIQKTQQPIIQNVVAVSTSIDNICYSSANIEISEKNTYIEQTNVQKKQKSNPAHTKIDAEEATDGRIFELKKEGRDIIFEIRDDSRFKVSRLIVHRCNKESHPDNFFDDAFSAAEGEPISLRKEARKYNSVAGFFYAANLDESVIAHFFYDQKTDSIKRGPQFVFEKDLNERQIRKFDEFIKKLKINKYNS